MLLPQSRSPAVPQSRSRQNEYQLPLLIEHIDARLLQRQQHNKVHYLDPFYNLSRRISYLCESYDRKHFFNHPGYSTSALHMYIPRSLIHRAEYPSNRIFSLCFFNLSGRISYLCESYNHKHCFKHPRYSTSALHMYIVLSIAPNILRTEYSPFV